MESVAQGLLLPELKLLETRKGRGGIELRVEKTSTFEVCPRCAQRSWSVYDRREVRLRDEPVRRIPVFLVVRKRRFSCGPCRRPFTEPVPGVRKGYRTTERYRRAIRQACEDYADLSRVRRRLGCSAGLLYRVFYEQLELEVRKRRRPWPEKVGLDEHYFKRKRGQFDPRGFVTMVVDQKAKGLYEVVDGRRKADLREALFDIPGRENVRLVSLDMSDTYKSFAKEFFPNAQLVADKFHVLRLLNPALTKYRKRVPGAHEDAYVRRILLRSRIKLHWRWRRRLDAWLLKHPELRAVYESKEALYRLYRTRGYKQAKKALTALTDSLALSTLPELKTLRRTLLRWRREILAYFVTRLTNARTEGLNGKAKLLKRRAYGYKSFDNYRLRLLAA